MMVAVFPHPLAPTLSELHERVLSAYMATYLAVDFDMQVESVSILARTKLEVHEVEAREREADPVALHIALDAHDEQVTQAMSALCVEDGIERELLAALTTYRKELALRRRVGAGVWQK